MGIRGVYYTYDSISWCGKEVAADSSQEVKAFIENEEKFYLKEFFLEISK